MSTKQLNCNRLQHAQKCLGKNLIDFLLIYLRTTSQIHLSRFFYTDFFKFFLKKVSLLFTYLLLSYIWSKRCKQVKFLTTLLQKKVTFLQRVYDIGFTTKYQRCSNNVVFLKSFYCIRTEKRDFRLCLAH